MEIEAVIFDLDGLMLDTEKSNAFIARELLQKLGFNTKPDFIQWYYENCTGHRDAFQKIIPAFFGINGADAEIFPKRLFEYRIQYYKSNPPRAKKGLIQFLDFLKAQGIKMGICSASKLDQIFVKMKMADVSLDYFDAITSGDEVKESKPHPQIYQIACEKLGVKPENAIAFEDTDLGVESASRAGVHVILVPDVKPNAVEIEGLCFGIVDSLDLAIPLLRKNI